jgi:hypothetical protein
MINVCYFNKNKKAGPARWLVSVIPATQEVEIGRIVVQGQLMQKIRKDLLEK